MRIPVLCLLRAREGRGAIRPAGRLTGTRRLGRAAAAGRTSPISFYDSGSGRNDGAGAGEVGGAGAERREQRGHRQSIAKFRSTDRKQGDC